MAPPSHLGFPPLPLGPESYSSTANWIKGLVGLKCQLGVGGGRCFDVQIGLMCGSLVSLVYLARPAQAVTVLGCP